MKFIGITIFISDIEQTIAFYENLFGKIPDKRGKNSCTFMFGNTKYFIHSRDAWEEGMPPNEDHFEFEVKDIEMQISKLKSEA